MVGCADVSNLNTTVIDKPESFSSDDVKSEKKVVPTKTEQVIEDTSLKQESIKNETLVKKDELKNNTINANTTLEEFNGKPTLLIFAGTFCPHCQTAMPDYKTLIWDNYKTELNIWIQVVDAGESSGKKFQTVINQGFNSSLDFEGITGRECDYIPSWLILDEKGNIEISSCGGEYDTVKMQETIVKLLPKL